MTQQCDLRRTEEPFRDLEFAGSRASFSTSIPISPAWVTAQATNPRVCERLNRTSGQPSSGSMVGLPCLPITKHQALGASSVTEDRA
jgi:hypothetical protein